MKYSLNAVALAALSSYAVAKEMVPDEKLAAEIFDSGIRHEHIMATKMVGNTPLVSRVIIVILHWS